MTILKRMTMKSCNIRDGKPLMTKIHPSKEKESNPRTKWIRLLFNERSEQASEEFNNTVKEVSHSIDK